MYFAENERRPNWAKDPAVVHFNNRYYLYYSIAPSEERPGSGIGIAESQDLVNWHYVREVEIKTDVHPHGFGAPAALVREGKVYLFYQSYGTGGKDAICLAVSENGLDFTIDPSSPIFHPLSPPGAAGVLLMRISSFTRESIFSMPLPAIRKIGCRRSLRPFRRGDFLLKAGNLLMKGSSLLRNFPGK